MSSKTVIIGDAGVGKTCIAQRLIDGKFSENCEPTIGAANVRYTVHTSKRDVQFNIWDTAGQERYRSLAPMYFSGSNSAVIVYDITSHHSFDVLDEFVELLQQKAPEYCIYALVGNKLDLAENREVSKEEAMNYSHKIGALFCLEVSAKTGESCAEIFQNLAECNELHIEEDITQEYIAEAPVENSSKNCNC